MWGYCSKLNAPFGKVKTNKGLVKFIFLSIITFGIYGLVVMSSLGNDMNIAVNRHDGKKTCTIAY